MDARYISCTDTAKLVRAALKKNFPGIKFSVKSSSYSGGASIHVKWTDGPTSKAVEKVAHKFQGSTFDGMTDSKTYHASTLDGEEVRFGADHVACSRSYTRAFIEAIVAQYCKMNGCNVSGIEISGTDENCHADAYNLGNSENHWFNELLWGTDVKNMYRAYEGMEETKQAEHDEYIRNEPQRRKEEQARQEREHQESILREQARAKREQARQEQDEKRQREQAARHSSPVIHTREQALRYLGLAGNATSDQIRATFRAKVKASADGKGGYTGDMDKLVKAKEKALQK